MIFFKIPWSAMLLSRYLNLVIIQYHGIYQSITIWYQHCAIIFDYKVLEKHTEKWACASVPAVTYYHIHKYMSTLIVTYTHIQSTLIKPPTSNKSVFFFSSRIGSVLLVFFHSEVRASQRSALEACDYVSVWCFCNGADGMHVSMILVWFC